MRRGAVFFFGGGGDLQIEIGDSDFCAFDLTRRAMPTARAADRYAHSAGPI